MLYRIASDVEGRVRLRCGRLAFTREQGLSIGAALASQPFVIGCEASHLTGSILIRYPVGCRDEALSFVDGLDHAALPPAQGADRDDAALLGEEFRARLFRLVVGRALRRLLLPPLLRNIWYVFRGLRFLARAFRASRTKRLGVETLDAAAIWATLAQGQFATASSIMFLISLSDLLEEYTRRKARTALAKSLLINVDSVWVLRGGAAVSIPVSELRTGDTAVVRTGAMIPVDGIVTGGEAMVNQSSMTGEPAPLRKCEGGAVFAGTVVEEGSLEIEVKALHNETRISRIMDLIDSAEGLKANAQGRAERLADRIVPFNFLLAAGVFLFTRSVEKSVYALLVDYSCAIRLATPIAVISAMHEASTRHMMVKGGKYLEAVAEADTVVFDKTGTLTLAMPQVSRVLPFEGYSRDEALRLAACLEEHFPHSAARAIVRRAKDEGLLHDEEHARVDYVVAHGIASTLHGKRVVIGSRHFICDDEGIAISSDQEALAEAESGGDSAIYLAVDGKVAGIVFISDRPRPEAAEAIAGLRRAGISRIVMLTGDSEPSARATCRQLGIDSFHAQALPEDKARIVRALKAEGRMIIMVGDGVNDSPALAEADVSVAMKDASDIAKEVADITLLRSDLRGLLLLREISVRLMKRIKNNYRGIIGFNSALLALGLGGLITPAGSALLHNASTMLISAASTRRLAK
ncbi:MAG: heavy metal translocating P-type ATPase [Clostridiales Family XIII bacterium]|jgi:heavy metal translocating P-type ATPase|nr:heavy metal translocating P-type ATPase [Clostridiales Family XIII bacterium]